MIFRLGVDVGGTHTDAVVLNEKNDVVASAKNLTTVDIMSGIDRSISEVLVDSNINVCSIKSVMIGTTHYSNAIVERKDLNSVAHFRLGAPNTLSIPPLSDVPGDLKSKISIYKFIVDGGVEYNGDILSSIDQCEIRECLQKIKGKVDAVSICGVFSPFFNMQEIRVKEIVIEELGNIPVTLSHNIGNIGLLERENSTILNASLLLLSNKVVAVIHEILSKKNINAWLYFSQNDGTLMPEKYAREYPILMVSSGQTNSMRGASHLGKIKNAMIVDVGGTTTDIGLVSNGFPHKSSFVSTIGGVRTNFHMPDIESIALGGGSIVNILPNGKVKIGPASVGYNLAKYSLVFGGDVLTITDIAVAKGLIAIGDVKLVKHLPIDLVNQVIDLYIDILGKAIHRMKINNNDIPLIVVGGGGFIINKEFKGISSILRPEKYDVANAIGVAMGMVGGQAEKLFSLKQISLDCAIEKTKKHAIQNAINAGALPDSVIVIDFEYEHIPYSTESEVRIFSKAAGVPYN
ncbi:Acetophenone carboxylase gamma subunit (plasmid) [Sodalis glossinidius str. 'morsitans']|uniref:Acetophenone carboxylase gamma subunit n=2 Tax=Sodalis glossinidius TaxID=63612 RepID=Q2NQ04_SODGM|nr:hydantoinase/oxoprolinase family protein [Sodalis glossinidius]BAE75771.1 putative hydantoinase [Sodalis glossinidius str. 'morsitans']CAI59363.2 hypothetical protein pSG2.03 [Sodalis glossinidius]CAI59577.2 hypothetical protein pSG2.03 [Sodalis glossinidius]CRL46920.1 Acetophenone carboxylase gamma subunit [Sodalis glossinidius str. 'morsitans']